MNGIDFAHFGISLAGGTVGGLAIAAWLGKKLISQMLNREEKKLQLSLDEKLAIHSAKLRLNAELELERVRAVGGVARIEHEVMFSRLQDRRADIIALLYGKFIRAGRMTADYVGHHSSDRTEEGIAIQKAAIDAQRDLYDYLEQHKVWLPVDCCKKVEAFTNELWEIAVTRQVYSLERQGSEQFYEDRSRELLRIWDAVQNKLPAAREALAQEFRTLVDPRATQTSPT